MKIKVSVCSSVGKKSRINQDNFFANGFINEKNKSRIKKSFIAKKAEQLLAICDGMGGEAKGEIASYIAVRKLETFRKRYSSLLARFDEHMDVYVHHANKAICEYIEGNGGVKMGSTAVVLCVNPQKGEAVSGNIGDSKALMFREGKLKKLSEDHNEAQSMVNLGIITEEEARTHSAKSKLTQHLGIRPDELVLEPFVSDTVILKKGDIFLLCSDGLTDMLSYDSIEKIMKEEKSAKKIANKLVTEADAAGGKDNTTVIVAEVI